MGALMQGALVAMVVGALSDLGMGRWPYAWIWTNFSYNIGHGVAARFGVMGPWGYLSLLFVYLGPGYGSSGQGPCWPGAVSVGRAGALHQHPAAFADRA
jgi:hypothetical protein